MFDSDILQVSSQYCNFYHEQDAQAGLNFFDEGEAVRFKASVEQMLQIRIENIGEQKKSEY